MTGNAGTDKFEPSPSSLRLYHSFYGRFFHRIRFRRAVRACRELEGQTALEIGCHDLSLFHAVDRDFEEYAGLDVNTDHAQANRAAMGWNNVRLYTQGAETLPFADRSFDLVISCETIEHVQDEDDVVREISRVLRPGGRLLITVPIEFGPLLLVKALMRWILRSPTPYEYSWRELLNASLLHRPDWVQRNDHKGYDFRATLKRCEQAGLTIERVERMPWRILPAGLNMGVLAVLSKPSDGATVSSGKAAA